MADVRLIDANALHKSIVESYELLHKMYEAAQEEQEIKYIAAQLVTFVECAMRVKNAPTIDAVPVAHGQWVRENIREKSYLRLCTVCRKIAYFCGEGCSYKYCPNCGAKMDGDET